MTFGANHSLTLSDELTITSNSLANRVNFNGELKGDKNLILGTKSHSVFGSTYDGSNFSGNIIIGGDNEVNITSNVADNGTFLKSGSSLTVSYTHLTLPTTPYV